MQYAAHGAMDASSPSPSRQRRLPRVSYSAPVRLSGEWSDREPWFVPLLAQSLDVSEGGMALVTPLHLRLDSAVTCSMRLGGRQAYFVGRVVWHRIAADGTKRVGIQFVSPSDEDTGVMRRLLALGQSHPHRVNLRFDGRPDTLTALARVTRTGLTLSAPLPILRRDTKVRFTFEGLGPTFQGRIDGVRLSHRHGMPALRVGIRVGDEARAGADETDAQPSTVPLAAPERADATPTAVEVPVPIASGAARVQDSRARANRLLAILPTALTLATLALGAVADHLVQRMLHEPAAAPARSAHASHETKPVPADARSERRPLESGPNSTTTAAAAVPTEHARVVSDEAFKPEFKWRRDRRELFLPLRGSLARIRHFALHSPPGIAINLPDTAGPRTGARVPVPHPGVSRIDLVPWQHGTRIRIWTDGIIDDYRVEVVPGGLRVVLPAEPSATQ
jgi:hypothetical protein